MRDLRFLTLGIVPEWHERANCTGTDPETFYPGIGGSPFLARKICARCEVTDECLQDAIDNADPHGIWGGKTGNQRKRLAKQAAKAATEPKEVAAA